MQELLRTNDWVLISYVQSLLRSEQIEAVVLDTHMSILEGSIGILPRRVMIAREDWERACSLLVEAELGGWISERPSE